MEASRIIGGLTRGQADMLRKGIGKKLYELMNRWIDLMIYGSKIYKQRHAMLTKQYPKKEDIPLNEEGKPAIWVDYKYEDVPFVEGGINRGFDEKKLLELKMQWLKFAKYCFNKSHSVCYALISVITAWLKAYYPVEFMAALLTISEGKKDKNNENKNIRYMKECEQIGIKILPPDINQSKNSWTPIPYDKHDNNGIGAIRLGLTGIAGISKETVENILIGQPYHSMIEFLEKTNPSKVNKSKVINLIKSGAFDCIDTNRNKLLREFIAIKEEDYEETIPVNTTKKHIIQYERELLGMSLTYKSRWETIEDGKDNIQFTGILTEVNPFISKKGQEHCRAKIETAEDEIQCLIFNKKWLNHQSYLINGRKVTFKGQKSGDSLIVNSIAYH